MQITLNGKTTEISDAPSLKIIVERFCKDKTPVVAELNGEIIKNTCWEQTRLKDGDNIELVSFVGGGGSSAART